MEDKQPILDALLSAFQTTRNLNDVTEPKVSIDAIVRGRDISSVLDFTADAYEAVTTSLASE